MPSYLPAYRRQTWRFPSVALLCRLFFAIALPLTGYSLRAQTPPPLHVSAAADLQPVLPALAAAYEKKTGVRIIPTFGSSAVLTQQIENGAPADVFLSADCSHPAQLVTAQLASNPQPVQYATGTLVLWARHSSPAQPLSLASLTSSKVSHIAVANAQHAPYGAAAMSELQALSLLPQLQSKLVVAENILQTSQFAESGNADAAFISLTIASSPHFREAGSFVPLPTRYQPIRQCGVALRRSPSAAAAQAFLQWLVSPDTQQRLPQFGLQPAR